MDLCMGLPTETRKGMDMGTGLTKNCIPISISIPVGKFLYPYPYGYGYGGYGYGLPKFIHIHIHPLAYTIPGMEINLGPAAAGWRDPYEGELGQ